MFKVKHSPHIYLVQHERDLATDESPIQAEDHLQQLIHETIACVVEIMPVQERLRQFIES